MRTIIGRSSGSPLELKVREPAALDSAAMQTMVRMRDGVRLATDTYLPDHAGRLPTVLVRLPYDKCGRYTFMPQCAPFFTERGYAFIVQDVRGKFRSEGETLPLVHEADDGSDTLDWISAQPWSNGIVGMWGDSYYGYTQWAAVASGHPALKAIVPRVTSVDLKVLTEWWGDSVVPLAFGTDYFAHHWVDQLTYDFAVDYSHRPLAEVYDEGFAAIGKRSAALDQVVRANGPGSYVRYRSGHPFDKLRVPVLHSVGWFDNLLPYSMTDYAALRARPDVADLQYLVADATDHENYHLRDVPVVPEKDHDASDSALADMLPTYLGAGLDFFDVFLRGRGRAESVQRATWFVGHDDWRTSPSWPPPKAQEVRLYLGAAGRASAGCEGGVLLRRPEATPAVARWVHDPANLVPSLPPNPFAFLLYWPDERTVQSREDVLTFTSEMMADPIDLTGPISVSLSLGSSCSSMHVIAKLCDVEPDGAAHMLASGQRLVREPEPGRLVEVSLSHIAYRMLPEHRLRLSIASSDFPLYLPHPGTQESPWWATDGTPNQQTLVTGGTASSFVSLTVSESTGV